MAGHDAVICCIIATGTVDVMAMIRFAALGDSVTSGYGDPMPGGGWRGWAVLLA